ncbi:MAG: Ig-like domain-containing protein [Tepidisphaerales bacterium]
MKTRARHAAPIEALEHRTLLAADFSLAAIPDTQYLVEVPGAPMLNAQTDWILNNAAAANIRFATQEGDLLRRGYSDYQAAQAHAAFAKLDATVPYTLDIGNHDYDNQFDDLDRHISSANFTSWFGDAHYQSIAISGFGGSSLDQRNRYQMFSVDGQQYMVLSLEWEAPDSTIAWAQGVINSHRQIPVILTTHEYLNASGRTSGPLDPLGNDGNGIFTKLVYPNPQIFLVLSGHTGAIRLQTSTNSTGSTVIETVGDDQGKGYMQLFTFSPNNNTIKITTYSPSSLLSDTSLGQTTYAFNFSTRFSFATGKIANDDTFAAPQNTAIAGNVLANDAGSGLAIASSTSPAHGTLTWNQPTPGAFTYTPNTGYHGNDAFTYTLSGGNTATVLLQVNSAPVAAADWVMIPESKSVTINVVANDSDPDGDALTPILTSLPAHGAVYADATGTLTYTPDPKYVGPDSFTYKASDGKAVSAPATVSVSVQPAPPIYNYPVAETTVSGTRANSYASLQATDGALETIAENSSNILDQRWQFNVAAGTEVTVCMNAWRASGADEYALAYSTNGTTWSSMTQIVPRSSLAITRIATPIPGGAGADPAEPYQMWLLPANTQGTVWIRATQTTKPYTGPSALAVDELFIRSGVPAGFQFTGTTAAPVLQVSAGTVTLADDLGSVRPNCTVRVLGGNLTAATTQHWTSLELSGGGKLNVSGNAALFSGTLSIASGSVLDLAGGTMVLSYAASSPVDTVRQYIQVGKLIATGVSNATLAQVDNATVHQTVWNNVPLGNGANFKQVLVKRVPIGDTNMDGQVTAADYLNIIANMGRAGAQWLDGDLDHDGVVTVNDLAAVSANLGAGNFAAGPALEADSSAAPALAASVKKNEPVHAAPATLHAARKPVRSSRLSALQRVFRASLRKDTLKRELRTNSERTPKEPRRQASEDAGPT